MPHALLLKYPGTNCDVETERALRAAGFTTQVQPIATATPQHVAKAQLVVFSGGFSYGDGNFEDYPDFFADEYAMENMKEDRARTFEDAMLYGAGVYEDKPALWLKLEAFSRAIRAHFDTETWPDKTLWEQAME